MSAEEIIASARRNGRTLLTEVEAKEILRAVGIPVVPTALARTQREAVSKAKNIGFPVALKISSPQVVHKSDVGGVKLDIKNVSQVRAAYKDIISSVSAKLPGVKIEGISVQQMARPGIEVILGVSKDPQFGPVVMFGLGGILVELLKDVSFRIVPLTKRDAAEMIREVKGYPLLQGYRGREGVDINFLEDLIVNLSDFIDKTPDIKELDLNPVIAYKDGAVVADARIILEG
ncbi:MAG: acetate--CoA ligase family protein [Dehalococcoidia bacterium]|nr:acetate--CoA ligase family protein [Dehalococcoidia bacterium]